MTQSVVVTQGRNKYEFTYSDYNDYNNPLNRIEAYMPGRMIGAPATARSCAT